MRSLSPPANCASCAFPNAARAHRWVPRCFQRSSDHVRDATLLVRGGFAVLLLAVSAQIALGPRRTLPVLTSRLRTQRQTTLTCPPFLSRAHKNQTPVALSRTVHGHTLERKTRAADDTSVCLLAPRVQLHGLFVSPLWLRPTHCPGRLTRCSCTCRMSASSITLRRAAASRFGETTIWRDLQLTLYPYDSRPATLTLHDRAESTTRPVDWLVALITAVAQALSVFAVVVLVPVAVVAVVSVTLLLVFKDWSQTYAGRGWPGAAHASTWARHSKRECMSIYAKNRRPWDV
jgi:hypothetical protein